MWLEVRKDTTTRELSKDSLCWWKIVTVQKKKIQHVILISRAICVVFTPVTFAFTTAGNHMVSNSILSECWENNHTSTVGSDRLLLSSDQDIGTFVAAFLYVCVCVRVFERVHVCRPGWYVCVHPAVTKFIILGMNPALHYTSVDNICREGKK